MKFLLLFIISFTSSAGEWLLYPSSKLQYKKLKKEYKLSDVFLSKERELLPRTVNKLLLKGSLKEKDINIIKSKFPELRVEENSSFKLYNRYEGLQWSLNNLGEQQRRWLSDIDTRLVQGVQGEDINIRGVTEKNTKIRVAIIDSGIDLKHPDLLGQIYSQPKECADLRKYNRCLATDEAEKCHKKFATVDNDGNGYPLDCNGWDITGKNNPYSEVSGNAKISDTDGHGTHVAGIIAAKDNSRGIKGIIQNVELLPVKVGVVSKNDDSELATDNIAKAILYATKTKTQIINLSLGWRINQDSLLMRQMIEHALNENILIVAAAGNDSHDEAIYPCSYQGVICVASHDINGELSSFSNFGPHIDILAPGTNILSTYPTTKRSKSFTQDPNYEYLSGTSQAAPHVTGVLALLLNQGHTATEAKLKLLKGSRLVENKSKIRFGNIDFNKSKDSKLNSFIDLKTKSPSLFNVSKDKVFKFKVKNLIGKARDVKISIKSEEGIELSQSEWFFKSLSTNKEIELESSFKSLPVEKRSYTIQVKVRTKTQEQVYYLAVNPIFIVSDKTQELDSINTYELLGEKNEYDLVRKFTSISHSRSQDYLGIKTKDAKTYLRLIKNVSGVYQQSEAKLLDEKESLIIKLSKLDLNSDSQEEYIVSYVDLTDEKRKIKFKVYDQNFKLTNILISKKNEYSNDPVVLNGGFKWLISPNSSKKVPTWISFGPAFTDKKPSPWDVMKPEVQAYHIYQLQEEGLKTLTLPKDWYPVNFLYQSHKSSFDGSAYFVAAKGRGFFKEYALFRLTDKVKKIKNIAYDKYFDFIEAFHLPMVNTKADNAFFFKPSILGTQKIFSLQVEDGELFTQEKEVSIPGKNIIRILRVDGQGNYIGQTSSELVGFHSGKLFEALSYTNARRIKHTLLESKLGVILPSQETPYLSSYTTVLTEQGFSFPSHNQVYPAQSCLEIGVEKVGESERMSFICGDSARILKIKVSK